MCSTDDADMYIYIYCSLFLPHQVCSTDDADRPIDRSIGGGGGNLGLTHAKNHTVRVAYAMLCCAIVLPVRKSDFRAGF